MGQRVENDSLPFLLNLSHAKTEFKDILRLFVLNNFP